MQNKHNQTAALPLLALVLLLFSPLAFAAPEPNAVLEVTGEGLIYLEVEFRSREGKELERYQFKANEDGLIVDGVALPGEGGGEYEITAFDRDGIATYSGAGSVPPQAANATAQQVSVLPKQKRFFELRIDLGTCLSPLGSAADTLTNSAETGTLVLPLGENA